MHGVKISCSTLKRVVRTGREAKGGLVCLERKKYDRSNKSYLTEEVKKAYIELIAEFAVRVRVMMIDGKMFDGKVVLIPCTEDYITHGLG